MNCVGSFVILIRFACFRCSSYRAWLCRGLIFHSFGHPLLWIPKLATSKQHWSPCSSLRLTINSRSALKFQGTLALNVYSSFMIRVLYAFEESWEGCLPSPLFVTCLRDPFLRSFYIRILLAVSIADAGTEFQALKTIWTGLRAAWWTCWGI